ncbi:MAG: sensor histidine kinase, partial [Flavobacteriaceae bacterium]
MLDSYKKQYTDQTIQFVMVDPLGKVLDSDETFFSLKKGQPIEKVHPFFQCIHSLKDVPVAEHIFNCVHLEIDGTDRTTDIRMVKKPNGTLIVIYDLTQHYDEYQLVAQARNESIINSELIIIKNNELEERERFKNRFIQNFSHELRNPLTSILSITNLLAETPLTSQQKKMIDFLRDSTQNLKLMLEDILSISMISSGRLSLTEKTFSLYKLLNLLRFTYSSKAKAKNIVFDMQIDDKVPEFVEADRLRLYQILANLLDNALKYTHRGTITLKVGLNQKRANRANVHFSIA